MNFFLSAGFGGLCAVIGAAIAYGAATLATRQRAKADAEQRQQDEMARAWDRFVWVMSHRDEFNPALTVNLLAQLTTTAERLGDQDLVAIGRQVSTELFRDSNIPPELPPSTTLPERADTEDASSDQEGL